MSTAWLLDVDGVLNARQPGWGGAPREGMAFASSIRRGFTIRFAPPLIQRIRDLHHTGLVEIRWCTTWCGDTAEIERVLSLPKFTSCWPDAARFVGELKLTAAQKVLADGDRLVWTDDDEVPVSGPLYEELSAGGRSLLIRPDTRRGLQPEHMDAIEAFVGTPESAA